MRTFGLVSALPAAVLFGVLAACGAASAQGLGGYSGSAAAGDVPPSGLGAFSERLTNATKTMLGKGVDPGKARALYAEASAAYRQASESRGESRQDLFLEAAEGFEDAADRWPDSALQQDALFLAGESYFFADHYPDANERYELLLKHYPNSKHLDTVEARRFAIAQYWLKMADLREPSFWTMNLMDDTRPWRDSFGHAVRIFDRIRIDDPTGKLADDATLAAGNAWFSRGRYIEADNFYTDLRKTFPSSDHQFHAHMLGLKAKLQSYMGADYSGVPLDEAEKLIRQIRRQFPQESEQEREYLTRAYAEIRFKQAEREWKMARYYDRRRQYGAARFYYELLASDYQETPHAERAETRLVEIRQEPDEPDQPLEWLVDLFPDEDTVTPLIATQPGAGGTR